jgi:hypothetical protein
MHNVLDAGIYITWGGGRGLGPGILEFFGPFLGSFNVLLSNYKIHPSPRQILYLVSLASLIIIAKPIKLKQHIAVFRYMYGFGSGTLVVIQKFRFHEHAWLILLLPFAMGEAPSI